MYLNDYEFAVEKSLHGTPEEQRLAKAFLRLHDQHRDRREDCPVCGCPSE